MKFKKTHSLLFLVFISADLIAQTAPSVIPLSVAPNALTCSNKSRSNLNYNKDINSAVFIHRGNSPVPALTTGNYYYDISKDGGNTWATDMGPTYIDTSTGFNKDSYRGRFPLCDIYNPVGNTNPDNAYIVYDGPYTALTPPAWRGQVFGVGRLNNTGVKSHVLTDTSFMDNMFVTKTGVAWRIGELPKRTTFPNYILNLGTGFWNSTTNDFNYTNCGFPILLDSNLGNVWDMDIAFADDGLTGYITIITNSDTNYTCFLDTTWYLSVFKTVDGGNTWSNNIDLDASKVLDPLLVNNIAISYSPGIDLDIVVDVNKNLHIITGVHPSSGYTYTYSPNIWGLFDIYTIDQGTTWKAELLDKPETYSGVFGNGVGNNSTLTEYNRPFASRSWDGTKLFFSWFDTDTNYWGTIGGNVYPDLHSRGYDLTTRLWTKARNMLITPTDTSLAFGKCRFGNGSYYVIDSVGKYTIPSTYLYDTNIVNTGQPVGIYYINGAVFYDSDFSIAGNPVNVPVSTCTPVSVFWGCALISVPEIAGDNHLFVSDNYPNPFNGSTSLDITLAKPSDIIIEVNNVVGQIISSKIYQNLSFEKNTLTIDGSSLSNGIYFLTVKASDEVITKKILVGN